MWCRAPLAQAFDTLFAMSALRPVARTIDVAPPEAPMQKKARTQAPKSPIAAPRSGVITVEEINAMVGAPELRHTEAISITVAYDEIDASRPMDTDQRIALEKIPGLYYRVYTQSDGSGIFRQEAATGPNNSQLFLFKDVSGKSGWHVCQKFDPQIKEALLKKLPHDNPCYAWSNGNADFVPTNMHVPFWAKKPYSVVSVSPLSIVSAAAIEKLTEENFLLRCELDEAVDAVGDDVGDTGKGKGKGKDKNTGKGGGWLNKSVSMITHMFEANWEGAFDLAKKFAHTSDEVFRKVRGNFANAISIQSFVHRSTN